MKNYTPQEINEVYIKNETFVGDTLNFEKAKRVNRIADIVTELMEHSEDVRKVKTNPPERTQRHASVLMDISPAAMLDRKEMDLMMEAMKLSDCLFIATNETGSLIRYSFCVEDIWG